jgi:hypothetical protein
MIQNCLVQQFINRLTEGVSNGGGGSDVEMRGLMRAVQVQLSSGIKNAQKKTTHHPTGNDPNPATQPNDPDDQGSKIFQGGLDRLEYWSLRKPSINRNACSSARDARRYSLTYITHTSSRNTHAGVDDIDMHGWLGFKPGRWG